MKKMRVLLADDHRMMLEGLKSLLLPEFEIAGAVEDGRELLSKAREVKPDVIVVDISMPNLNGIDAIQQLKEEGSEAKIVFLTMHQDAVYAAKAFEAGASGFVMKHSAPDELVKAIREALMGRTYVTPLIAGELIQSYKSGIHMQLDILRKLSSRQREILQLLAEGKSAKEIAHILHLSVRTVEAHKYRLMEQIGVRSNAELVLFAIKHGIVSL
jgi:DNA-binding NarL/FixJ family response regulator